MRTRVAVLISAAIVLTGLTVPLAAQADTTASHTNAGLARSAADLAVPQLARFGANGKLWVPPANLGRRTVEVPPRWWAIEAAIRFGADIVLVRPGTLPPGNGAESSDDGVLQNINPGKPVLVRPRDAWGSVVGSGTIATGDNTGYAFVNLTNISIVGFDFRNQVINIRNSHDFTMARFTFGLMNVIANGGSGSRNISLVEGVSPVLTSTDVDRIAVRTANYRNITNLVLNGIYAAPPAKGRFSDAHNDTLQTSSTGGRINGLTIANSILFQASSQVFQCSNVTGLVIFNSALVGGLRASERFPLPADRYVPTGENTLWGDSRGSVVGYSYILGSINSDHHFSSVVDTVTGTRPSQPGFTVDPSFADPNTPQTAWLDSVSPVPTDDYLKAIWTW
jgi:hypothetical protein